MISPHVVKSPMSAYGAKSSSAVDPFGQIVHKLSFVGSPPVGARIGGLVGWVIGGVDEPSLSSMMLPQSNPASDA